MCDQINQCFMSVHIEVVLDTHSVKEVNVCILDTRCPASDKVCIFSHHSNNEMFIKRTPLTKNRCAVQNCNVNYIHTETP